MSEGAFLLFFFIFKRIINGLVNVYLKLFILIIFVENIIFEVYIEKLGFIDFKIWKSV